MYEMITADVPFRGGSPIDISLRHINEIPQSPSKLVREIPENLEKIVMRCLEKNPEDRYRSVEQLKDDLNNFLDGKPVATDKISSNGNKKTVTFTGLKTYWEQDSRLEKILKKYDRTNKRIRALLIFTNSLFFTAAVTFLILFIFSSIRLNNISALNLNVEIPDVVGTEFKSAKSLISLYGLDIEVEKNVYHKSIPSNHIISQKPAAGTTTRGATILVTVSRGKEILLATVPDLQGMKKSDAIGALENHGLLPGNINEEFSETVEENKVIDQEPDAGTSVEQDTEIKFTVSKGKQLITIPNIIGYDYAYAGLNLESLGLFTVFKMKTDLTVQPGTVIAVEPVGGSQVYKNSTVVVFISTSQQLATVPELNGIDLEKAVQALGDAGIEYEIAYIKVDYSIQRNSIVAQFPEPSDQIAQNEKIILFVGQ